MMDISLTIALEFLELKKKEHVEKVLNMTNLVVEMTS
jgi:hypothetical protein